MFTVSVIGNLGADARKVVENGSEFIAFNVAHQDKFTDKDGKEIVTTEWISCTIHGNRDNLLQYLKRGTKVFVTGRAQTRVYSSPKLKRMLGGVNCFVDRIELVGGTSDPVPRRLILPDGEIIETQKFFWIPVEKAKQAGATKNKNAMLFSEHGGQFEVRSDGFVAAIVESQEQPSQDQEVTTEEPQQ